jgi:hypothetical protein
MHRFTIVFLLALWGAPTPAQLSASHTVSNGLFDVELGSGAVSDGTGPGSYTSLAATLRDFAGVWMQVEIGAEVLSPRVHVTAAPYALHARSSESAVLLNGLPAGSYLDTSATAQAKAGGLSVGTLTVSGDLNLGAPGAKLVATPGALTITAGDQDSDDLVLNAGNDLTDGQIYIGGGGGMQLSSGEGTFTFVNRVSGLGTAQIDPDGNFLAIGELRFGGGVSGRLTANNAGSTLIGGDSASDDLTLQCGPSTTSGSITMLGNSSMTLRAGNGAFNFVSAPSGISLAGIDPSGNFSSTGDFTMGGNQIHLGTPGSTRMVRNPTFDDLYFARDEDQNQITSTFSVFTNVGIQQMRINDGDEAPTFFDGAVNANGLDYAEAFSITDPTLEPGEVVVFDPERPGFISRATEVYSPHLVGVISGKPGFLTGSSFDAEEAADPVVAQGMRAALDAGNYDAAKAASLVLERKKAELQRAVALAGRLPVKVDATYGPIRAGDHLTSSETPGHAMAMRDAGPSIGVALESWSGPGTGVVLAFVQRGYYTPKALIAETSAAQRQLAEALEDRTPDPASGVQMLPSNLQYVLDRSGGGDARFSIFRDGAADEPQAEVFRVDERGNVWAQGAFRPRSMDLAEVFDLSERVEAGDVLVVDRAQPGKLARGRSGEDGAVVGVVAADPGVLLGSDVSRLLAGDPALARALEQARAAGDLRAEAQIWGELEARFAATRAPIALSGTVTVKVDARFGAIEPGDLLVTSPTLGHAMRVDDPKPGAVVGKALEALPAGAGRIRMLVWQR